MRWCLLRVNGRPIPSVRLRKGAGGALEVVLPDPEFGDITLTPAFILEIMDFQVPKDHREAHPESTWARVTYDELLAILRDIQAGA